MNNQNVFSNPFLNNKGTDLTDIYNKINTLKMQQQQREDTNKREERMFEQMNNITLTLSNINTSLELINERIERLEEQNE